MEGEKEKLAIKTAATLYCALAGIPQARVIILTFDDEVYLVKDERFEPANTVLRRLLKALEVQNGTNLPKAMKVAIELMKKCLTHRKVLFILTDGDTSRDESIMKTMTDAERNGIQVVCIGITESEKQELSRTSLRTNTSSSSAKRNRPHQKIGSQRNFPLPKHPMNLILKLVV